MTSTSAGTSSTVFGSVTIFCSSISLFYTIYILIAVGSALSGLFSAVFAGIALDNVLMIVAGSLAIAAGKQVVNKGLWLSAIAVSGLSSLLYLAAVIFLAVYGTFSATTLTGVVINCCLQLGLLISVSVGLGMAESERQKRQHLHQTSLEVQMPASNYNQHPESRPPLPQMAQMPPSYCSIMNGDESCYTALPTNTRLTQLQQTSLEVQMSASNYNQQPESRPALTQMADMPPSYSQQPKYHVPLPQMEPPPRYDDKAMLVA